MIAEIGVKKINKENYPRGYSSTRYQGMTGCFFFGHKAEKGFRFHSEI